MRFSVGYSIRHTDSLIDEVIKNRDRIEEIYFSYGKMPSGRNDQTIAYGMSEAEAIEKMNSGLIRLNEAGLGFNILFNAACYGARAQSKELFSEIGDTVYMLMSEINLRSVTTTSPLIAKFIKQNFEGLDVRASVNMGVGSPAGLDYIAEYFDSFYLKRELNRDISAVSAMRDYAHSIGKEMLILANSGCLNDCTAHQFHDSLVAHESEIALMDNGYQFTGVCKSYLDGNRDIDKIISRTNFIRPEDTEKYEGLVPFMKLATRVNPNPERIIRAYCERARFIGNAFNLLEPDHSGVMYPYILDNSLIESEIVNEHLIYSNLKNAFINTEEKIC